MLISTRHVSVAAAMAVGALIWRAVPAAYVPVPFGGWVVMAVATAACFVPSMARGVDRALDAIRRPSPQRRAIAAATIAIVASIYLIVTAARQERDFFPKSQDDQSYVIQMQMLARGRLWMHAYPEQLPDFFDSFHVIVRPAYASAYFPGTAMMLVPTVWLGLPAWLGPVIVAGAIVGLMYRIVTELIDGVAGAVAALLVISPNWFRMLSIMVMSQLPALLLGLILIWAWLRWRQSRHAAWILVMGAAAGWMLITRPIDAICFIVPVGASLCLYSGRGQGRGCISPAAPLAPSPQPSPGVPGAGAKRQLLRAPALFFLGATPFLLVQAIQNIGITGHLFQTPFGMYIARDQPQTSFGFHRFDPMIRPQSVIAQKRLHYDAFVTPFIKKHTLSQTPLWLREHLPQIVDVTLPARALLILVPIGLLGIGKDPRRWILLATVPLFIALYFCYTFFLEHYAVLIVPPVVMAVALAPVVLRDAVSKIGRNLYLAANCFIVIISLSMLPELNAKMFEVTDEFFRSPMLRWLHDELPNRVATPAVVLFRFHPELPLSGENVTVREPVYNTDVAWPDDAPIIRAHDLAERNGEIFRYYAQRQPDRTFYVFDRGDLSLHLLGRAADLARPGAAATQPSHDQTGAR